METRACNILTTILCLGAVLLSGLIGFILH